eukprot:TRINITY_DN17125_c0_g1_i1.p1 TRINITY_DN17125_c0_g1~~TRINITY_DN17125_c0_g1_i1.p1  ORF type:complete len:196 (+),score=37.88 TRINITY_DN17125_c0_g1_i1:219-806(+)
MAEFQRLISPAQQRALLARYEGLSDSSRLSALRRVRSFLDDAVDDLAKQREATLYSVGMDMSYDTRQGLDARVRDYTETLRELGTEARSVEARHSRRPQKSSKEESQKPYLSNIFNRELDRARAAAAAATNSGVVSPTHGGSQPAFSQRVSPKPVHQQLAQQQSVRRDPSAFEGEPAEEEDDRDPSHDLLGDLLM